MVRFAAHAMDRRNFLKKTAAGLVLLPGFDLEDLARGILRRTSTVALIRTSSRQEGVIRAMALLNPTGMAGKRVVVKPNFNSSDGGPAGTHDDTLTQLVAELKARDARDVTVGESSGPRGTTSVLEAKGTLTSPSRTGPFSTLREPTGLRDTTSPAWSPTSSTW